MFTFEIHLENEGEKSVLIDSIISYYTIPLSQDPHFVGVPDSVDDLIERGYIRWQRASDFDDSSFYNLCLPQLSFKSD